VRRSLLEAAAQGGELRFAIAVSQEGSARPIEALRALCGTEAADEADIVRLGLDAIAAGAWVDPLDVAALRAAQARPAA
jgi:hypothetical protein